MSSAVPVLLAPPGYFSTSTAADDLLVTRGTVSRWIRQQRLRAELFHGSYIVREEDLRNFKEGYSSETKPWRALEAKIKDIFPDGIDV